MEHDHEPNIQKAFQQFFTRWVEEQTSQELALVPEKVGRNALRRVVRDNALIEIHRVTEQVVSDRHRMVRFENGDPV